MEEPDGLKAMSLKQIAQKYEIGSKTAKKWISLIKPEIKPDGYFYNPKQLRKIFEHLG